MFNDGPVLFQGRWCMQRLRFPVHIFSDFQDFQACEIALFPADKSLFQILGGPGFIEPDSFRTVGGTEFYWAFEHEGLRFMITLNEFQPLAMVTANPPDPDGVKKALKLLGIEAPVTISHTHAAPTKCAKNIARYGVWVFQSGTDLIPLAVFSCKQNADAWISQHQMSGTLRAYPLDISRSEVFCRFSELPATPNHPSGLIDETGEKYHYRQGQQI